MVQRHLRSPADRPQRRTMPRARSAEEAWAVLRDEAATCRACDLWRQATQTVFGEGPVKADVIFVGEQPGDQEDLAGKPFVGPAGAMFDKALAEAGIDRGRTYVTNAVKHFKHVQRGKRRLHQKPNAGEIKACRWWLTQEIGTIRPKLVVALGATALQSVAGKATAISKLRGEVVPHGVKDADPATDLFVTVHPSYLLRVPDREARRAAYQQFLEDLRKIAAHIE
ncbi:UdgX family uracil-DNA binding protein [Rhodoligotrophos ferricapiens]|uniref:UdgX family uracil-DNA binding protein n=1 Tax=Rhodoligotrophos ferricapiens TaxID=3069264 RepID=UPI003D81BEF9